MSFSMSRDEFAAYLDSVRITGEVATARENNLDHIQGFLDGNEHQQPSPPQPSPRTWGTDPPGDRSQTEYENPHAPPRQRYGRTPPAR